MEAIRKPISIPTALEYLQHYFYRGEAETVALDACENRVLAEPIIASYPIPPFHKSLYDGFALRAADTKDTPVQFEVIERVAAGDVGNKSVKSNQAVRIMTGAALPPGCDTVIMFEKVKEFSENGSVFIEIDQPLEKWSDVLPAGTETQEGTELAAAGTVINPGVKAILATFGYSQVSVMKKPLIGVLATGSELLEPEQAMEPGKIRNSNAYAAMAQIKRAGGIARYFGKLDDELEASTEAVRKAFHEVDLLITTGGVSVGDFDLLPAVYKQLRAEVLFNKISMRPGSVTTAAEWNGKLLLGLSGNPSACYVGFEIFARPFIKHYLGRETDSQKVMARLAVPIQDGNRFTRFVRGKLLFQEGSLLTKPVGLDKSGTVTSLAGTTALIILPPRDHGYVTGELVETIVVEEYTV